MCKKTNYKIPNPRIDKCMRNLIDALKTSDYETVGSCCGHGKHPQTIIVKGKGDVIFELNSMTIIPRKRNFYRRDKEGYYYIPELEK